MKVNKFRQTIVDKRWMLKPSPRQLRQFKSECGAKAHPAGVRASYPKAKPVRVRRESPHENPGFRQPFEPALRVVVPHEPEQRAAANRGETGRRQYFVECACVGVQARPRRREPFRVRQGRRAYRDGRAGNRPGTQRGAEFCRHGFCHDREPETKPGKP